MTDEYLITQKIAEVAATADQYPGVVIIHHVPRQTVMYMSKLGLQLLDTTLAELESLGPTYATTYFNPVESREYMAEIWKLLDDDRPYTVRTFYQQVRTNERPGWSWYLTSMRLLLRDERQNPLLVIFLAAPLHPDNHFAAKVQRLIDENDFLRQHSTAFSRLTTRERQILARLSRSQSSDEIAEALFISAQTVNTHRRNLRQKLGASTAYELGQYARAFDLI